MKLACQESMAPGKTLAEKMDNLAAAGYEGIELGGSGLCDRVDEVKKAAAGHPVKPCSICSGFRGSPMDTDKKERDKASEDMHRLLEVAGELTMSGLIMVPIFGGPKIADLSPYMTAVQLEKELFVRQCQEWAETAIKAGTVLLIEPLNRYETHLIRKLSDGVEICERVNSPGVKIMADFFHMSIEERDIPASIRSAGSHIAHVHLADSTRELPGYGHTDFRSGFAALKEAGYTGYMALECGIPGSDRQAELKKSADYMRGLMQ